ncbi:hypothetical protein M2146_002735 [Lachnospiraceae bacterium PF1-22]|uniref:hypothetical protein n=1 Tax=Ohessyouella blattaphilus TaxID=2949333 RepID=UPI003E2E6512
MNTMKRLWYKEEIVPVLDQVVGFQGGFVGIAYDETTARYYIYLSKGNQLRLKMEMSTFGESNIVLHYKNDDVIEIWIEDIDGEMVPYMEFNTKTEEFGIVYRLKDE